ncbi:hypothetical protein [Archangium minus]|uniref:hypothetical protein n=1 Tax=Archangium minus TaxID=83450 RepID=UPI0037C05512
MSDSELLSCQFHPQAAAGWFCPACNANLCPSCAVLESVASTDLSSCGQCGAAVEELKVHRSRTPFLRRLLETWMYPLKPSGLLALLGVGAVVALARGVFHITPSLPKLAVLVVWLGCFWGSLFWIVRSTAMGAEHFTAPDFTSVMHDLVDPAIRGLLATALLWVPAILFIVFSLGGAEGLGPLFLLLLIATLLYAPLALLFAATGESKLSLLNPFKVIGVGMSLGQPYLMVAAFLVPLAGLYVLLTVVGKWVASWPVPLVAPVVGEALSLYAPFVMARMLGLLLYVHGDRVGYGVDSEFYEAALPGVKPRGKKRAARGASREPHAPPSPLESEVMRAVEANALDQALELYRRLPERLPPLNAASHLAVGQRAATVGDYHVAVRALKQVGQHSPEDPLAPRACVILARLYGERLGDTESAQKLYRHVVSRYPGTDAARFAQSKLTPA